MSDQIISDEEKSALLDGVESGDVEVHSSTGPRYATVAEFSIPPHNCIVSNSFPRLQKLNRNFAGGFGKAATVLLNRKVDVLPGPITVDTWGEFSARGDAPSVLYAFSANPLTGNAVVIVQAALVGHIVETFFGGPALRRGERRGGEFTPGELKVVSLFCDELANAVATTWKGVAELSPKRTGLHQSTDVVDVLDGAAEIVACEFVAQFGDEHFEFHVAWPIAMLAPLLPVLEGQKKNRDAAQDARWKQVLRASLPDATVGLTTCIGNARLNLRSIADLAAGDVIDFVNPRRGRVFAGSVPVLEGRFGVHDGRYAIEAGRWLTNDAEPRAN